MKIYGRKLGLNRKLYGGKMNNVNILGRKLSVNSNEKHYIPFLEKEKSSGLERDFRPHQDHINLVKNHLAMEGQQSFIHHGKKMTDRKAWQRKKH